MIQKAVHKLLRRRHFWRDMDFSELSEMYISILFRSLSINLTSIFIPLYMLNLGYKPVDVMYLIASYFAARFLFFDFVSGWLTSKVGPKHTIIASYVLLTISTVQFLTLSSIHWPIWLLGAIWGGSSSFFCIPFHVDFSRVNHKAHGGKELAYIHILEKVSAILGPIVSGFVGTIFGGQYIFLAAIFILFVGGIPLLRTAEPIKIGEPLNLSSIKFGLIKRDILSFIGFGIENTFCGVLWPLYLSLFVIIGGTAYAKLGVLASMAVLVSIATAFTMGKLVDTQRGRLLLRTGAILNAGLHLIRPFVGGYASALVINAANDGLTTSYRLPYTKGMYDAGDSKEGSRVAYFTMMEWIGSYTKAMAWMILAGLTAFMSGHSVIVIGFMIAAASSLLIIVESYPALSKKSEI